MNVKKVQHNYSFLVWVALLGGLIGSVRSYFLVIATAVSRTMLMNAILQDIFYVKTREAGQEEGKETRAGDDDLVNMSSNLKRT